MHSDRHAWRTLAAHARALTLAVDDGEVDALTCAAAMNLLQPTSEAGSALLVATDGALTAVHACGVLARSVPLVVRPSPGVSAIIDAGRPIRSPGGLGALHLTSTPVPHTDLLLVPVLYGGRPARVLAAAAPSISPTLASALGTVAATAAVAYSARRDRWTDAIVQRSPDPVLLLERDGSIRTVSSGLARLLGTDPDAIAGRLAIELAHPSDTEPLLIALGRARDGQPADGVDLRCRHSDGGWIHTEATVTPRLGACGLRGLVLRLRDVHERKALEAELAHWVFHDPRTGLANRALLRERIRCAADAAIRKRTRLVLIVIDVDGLRDVSESLGSNQGDRALSVIADRLRACTSPGSTVARLGDGEFAILTVAQPEMAGQLAEAVAEALAEPVPLPQGPVLLQAAIGTRIADPDTSAGIDADQLLNDAGLALSAARRTGERTPRLYQPQMQQEIEDQITLRGELFDAVRQGQFVLHYQPVVELATRQTVGFEALLRWHHPDRGLIAPDQFIPHAERTGLIVQLGAWALDQAGADAAELRRAFGDALTMNVNVSPRQLRSDDIITVVRDAVNGCPFPPAALCLEITESALANGDDVARRLWQLRELGVRLALDDFGTGYAAYGQLQSLPFDTIKIDRSFTQYLGPAETQPALARDMIRMGHSLGLKMVAEGVETADQERELRALNCQYGQGYRYGRPMPLPQAIHQLSA